MLESRLEYLFDCYIHENCSPKEERELMTLLAQSENETDIKKLIEKITEDEGSKIPMPDSVAADILQRILQKEKAKVVSIKSRKIAFRPGMWRVAAAIVVLFISGISYWIHTKESTNKITASVIPSEKNSAIIPGGNHAILTMADGSKIVLDSVQNGKIKRGNTIINKENDLLIYDGSVSSKTVAPVTYNTLTTPRGGQYQVVLPDGSKAWLNASSSLHYPTAFTGKQRLVYLTGEAYFEVTKNKEQPFLVKVNDMQIEVLGTHFNVNAYADESNIKTSLLEGRVKIIKGNISGLLKPGQQGVLENNEDDLKIKNANMDEVMAWKNGLFQFDGAGIKSIMREISRWYDVDIVYSGKVPLRSFEGKINRDAQLSDVLKILELSNVKFFVIDRKIIVE